MKLEFKHQERYSRGQLLLRTFFGYLYIMIPHGFVLFFIAIGSSVLQFLAFWAVLFTGKYPKGMFEYQVGFIAWYLRLCARMVNIADGYPSFGLKGNDENVKLAVEYPEKLSRGLLILRVLFGAFYIFLPHLFVLYFRMIWVGILMFLAWWIVLFTGNYPRNFFDWVSGTFRWGTRVALYSMFMTDKYPAFTGEPLAEEAYIE